MPSEFTVSMSEWLYPSESCLDFFFCDCIRSNHTLGNNTTQQFLVQSVHTCQLAALPEKEERGEPSTTVVERQRCVHLLNSFSTPIKHQTCCHRFASSTINPHHLNRINPKAHMICLCTVKHSLTKSSRSVPAVQPVESLQYKSPRGVLSIKL